MLRNVQRAAKRGYAVAASAASLEVGLGDPGPRRIIVSWRNPAESDDDKSDVNAGARLHRFPEQRCINDADENALEPGLPRGRQVGVRSSLGVSALLRRERRLL